MGLTAAAWNGRRASTEPKVAGSSPAVRAILLPLPRVTSRRRAFAAGRGALSAARPGRLAGPGMKPPRLWTTMVKLRCRAKDPCETHDQPPRSGGRDGRGRHCAEADRASHTGSL